ncbi:uncharacterized protein [Panulirus ornatus]|uniref:uncharacterized protein isoform X1 n=1 Tax=Panulirus ornatus TaxID=150431 RepID=UPI003A84CDCB
MAVTRRTHLSGGGRRSYRDTTVACHQWLRSNYMRKLCISSYWHSGLFQRLVTSTGQRATNELGPEPCKNMCLQHLLIWSSITCTLYIYMLHLFIQDNAVTESSSREQTLITNSAEMYSPSRLFMSMIRAKISEFVVCRMCSLLGMSR